LFAHFIFGTEAAPFGDQDGNAIYQGENACAGNAMQAVGIGTEGTKASGTDKNIGPFSDRCGIEAGLAHEIRAARNELLNDSLGTIIGTGMFARWALGELSFNALIGACLGKLLGDANAVVDGHIVG
jgi:hypothetical protein